MGQASIRLRGQLSADNLSPALVQPDPNKPLEPLESFGLEWQAARFQLLRLFTLDRHLCLPVQEVTLLSEFR